MAQKTTPSTGASTGEEPLTMKHFEPQIGMMAPRPSAQNWRRECVKKVLKAYKNIKSSMSPSTRQELYTYIRRGEWIRSARNPSNYALFRSLKGLIPTRGHGRLYYPHLFVCHAIWGPEDWVVRLLYEFSAHWGVLFNMDKLTYPKIDDPNKEYLLFLGKTPVKSGGGSQASMSCNTHALGSAPRHDRAPLPLRPSGGAGAPAGKQPSKPAQNAQATGQFAKPATPQQNEDEIKKEVSRVDAANLPTVVQDAVRPNSINTNQAQAKAQPCQAMQGTA
ncbi:hypothetical protein MRS44_008619 [Fusarium solani]|jgi:hypothetical protein|uniref:Uncharacterized protein n=1 Tax=Fusarium solani TaxID=169388 RepID=A0A9P9KFV2_FUSSL|nr:uncharacterized protein B0J15DRAFT_547609 [Fusarium solani]KAH7259978.1 hypothetical protein B0J15DRAFT_547609 [Fusarium solani]KAJ3463833.1 hypothetical protein MRS44_008619 [Fusarium solani]